MAFSINLYLDNSISEKKLEILKTSDSIAYKEAVKKISNNILPIYLYLRFSGRTIKVSVERKCTQQQWDVQKQKVNPRFYKTGSTELNKYLGNLIDKTSKIHEQNLSEKKISSKENLKSLIDLENNRDTERNPSVDNAFDEFIESSQLTKQKSTITVYNTVYKHLTNYSKSKRFKLSYENFDLSFEDKYRSYLINQLDLSNNTVAKQFKTIKTFLNYCTDRDYNNLLTYKKFNTREIEGEIYVLTLEELMKLKDFDFIEERLNNVRDVFCFSCFTGLRYSDVANLKHENIDDGMINISSVKTNQPLNIPLSLFAKRILGLYINNETPLPVVNSQKTNKYLKEIGELMNLNEQVRKTTYKGNEKIEIYVPKKEILTFHMGRKTFITNSLVLGMSETETKKISGHKKDDSFRKYVNIADNILKKKVNDNWNLDKIKTITNQSN